MSPAQLRYSNNSMEQKEDTCPPTSLYKEIDAGKSEVSPDTSRYPTRSQPKAPFKGSVTCSDEVVHKKTAAKGKLKRSLQECLEMVDGTSCDKMHSTSSHEDRVNSSQMNLSESKTKGGTCPKCLKVFTDLHSLTLHVKEHNTEDTICGICNKKLSSASSLDRHMLTHTGEKPFKCKYCPQCFTTNGNMNRHMHTHELEMVAKSSGPKASRASVKRKELTPTMLKKDLNDEGTLREAKLSVQEEDETAPPSRKRLKMTTSGESSKVAEVLVNLEVSKMPESCDAGESSKIAEVLDSLKVEQLHPLENTRDVTENLSVKVETKKNRAPDHELKVVTGFDDLCHISFSSAKFGLVAKKACEETIRLPYCDSDYSYKCQLCERFFPCAYTLKMHETFHQSPQGTVCHECHSHFGSPELLEEHRIKYHQNLAENVDIGSVGFMGALGLHRRANLFQLLPQAQEETGSSLPAQHYAASRNRQKRKISEDRVARLQKKKLASKKKGKDEDDPKSPRMGVLIPKAEDKTSLQEESAVKDVVLCMENIEVNADPAMDILEAPGSSTVQSSHQESSNDFADISSIISNLAARPGPSSEGSSNGTPRSSGSETDNYSLRNYLKGYKTKGYKGKGSLTKVKQHYFCSRCNYKTTEKSSLMRHMLTHDKERPFKCTKCGMTFTTKSNGERHAKTIHRLPKNELITAIDYNLSASGSNKSQKMCKYCYNLFENNRALQHHLRSKTNNCKKKPFICRECRQGFSTKNNCHRHIQNLHKELLHQVKTDIFIIVNRYLKSLARKNKERSARAAKAAKNVDESSNSNTSCYESATSPVQQSFQQPSEASDVDSSNSEASSYDVPSPVLQQNIEQQTSVDESSNHKTFSSVAPSSRSQLSMEQGMGASVGGSSNSEFSTCENPSPIPQHNREVQYSFNDDDRVKAAESLVSLSEGLDLSRGFESVVQQSHSEDSPLDLSIRAIDLTERSNSSLAQRYNVGHSSFNGSISLALLTSPNPPTLMNRELVNYSAFATPLNLTKKQNSNSNASSMDQNASTPIALLSNNKPQPSTSRSHSVLPALQPKTPKHACNYCNKRFTQKSNKERHVKNLHPEHAKPRRNKNFSPSHQGKHASGQASSTLSSATREALLTRVLQHTDGNKQLHVESNHSINIAIKEEPVPAEEGINSDLENVDLASVSSVINTANSPKFTKYLTEDCNTFSQRSPDQSSSEPPRKKPKASKPEGERSLSCDFPTCNKTFNCRSSLKRHSVIHTGERAYECQYCQKQFTTNSNMVRHTINKHKVSPPRRSVPSPAGQATTSADLSNSNGSTESALHESGPKSCPMTIPSNQSAWPTNFAETANNSNGNVESVLHGFRSEQVLGELCASPATRREYPEPNRSPDLPEISQAAMPYASLSAALDCTVCNTSYKTESDRWNHMKQLHPLEYGRMHGRHVNLPDIVSIWKKSGCVKLKR